MSLQESGGSVEPGGEVQAAPGQTIGSAAAIAPISNEPDRFRILVVDDEPTIRGVIAQVLRLDGYDAVEAASAEEALVAFRAAPFPVVITDIVMGGMSGLDLLQELKSIASETLVVVMTSQASLEVATIALRGGAYDFMTKPFEDLIMISAVAQRASATLDLQSRNRLLSSQLEVYARELERLNVSLKDTADRDWLTGLSNRRRLRSALDSELSRAMRHGLPFAVLLLDVDHFKAYNDRCGHLAGDEALRAVADVLRSTGRAEDLCARYGGEEFVVLLPETNRANARLCAEKIRLLVQEHRLPNIDNKPTTGVTVSLGIACFPEDGPDGDALLGRADAALYLAKKGGRNRVEG